MSVLLWSALIMGLVSNFHCLGMCGPIALSVPVKSTTIIGRAFEVLTYNIGRISTYVLLGVLFGLLGKGLSLTGFQQYLSIGFGVLMVLYAFLPNVFYRLNIRLPKAISSQLFKLKQNYFKHFKRSNKKGLFVFGLLNGLLPCGMVYIALAGALNAGSWLEGAGFMLFFGIGTLPIMLLVPMLKAQLSLSSIRNVKRFIPVFIFLFGVVLILRGSNLGIPYVSPELSKASISKPIKCH